MTSPSDKPKSGSPQPAPEGSPKAREAGKTNGPRLPKSAEDMNIRTPTEEVAPPLDPPGPGSGRGQSPAKHADGVNVPNGRRAKERR